MEKQITKYTIRIKPIKYLVGGLLCLSSFVIPDLSLGLMVGLMVINPIPLKYQLRDRIDSFSGDFLKLSIKGCWIAEKIKRRVSRVLNLAHLSFLSGVEDE